jgi:hypothetical protein
MKTYGVFEVRPDKRSHDSSCVQWCQNKASAAHLAPLVTKKASCDHPGSTVRARKHEPDTTEERQRWPPT